MVMCLARCVHQTADDSNSKAQARRISFCKPFRYISHFIFYMACMLGHDTGTSKMHSCDINTGAVFYRKKRLFSAL